MHSFAQLLRDRGLGGELLRGFLGTGALRALYMLLTFAVSLLLARALGPTGFGTYSFAFAVAGLLAIPCQFGLPMLIVREGARYELNKEWGLFKGLMRRAIQIVIGFFALILVGAILTFEFFPGRVDNVSFQTMATALLLVPLISLCRLCSAALQSLQKVLHGQLSELLLRPALFLILTGGALALAGAFTSSIAMRLHVIAWTLALVVAAVLMLSTIPSEARRVTPKYETRTWMRSVLPLSLIAGMQVINTHTDIVMLGMLATKELVGIYRVAAQAAVLVSFTLIAINTVIAPQVARLYQAGDRDKLQRMVTLSARGILATSIPIAAAFVIFGKSILGYFFGEAYEAGHFALAILCGGHVLNAAFGSVDLLLNMTGHANDAAKGFAVAAVSNIFLNLALIPYFGAEGAALATALSLGLWNLLLYQQVTKRIWINSMAFPISTKAGRGG